MRLVARFCLSVFVLLQLVGCGQKSAGLQESAVSPDQKLFENGMNFLEKNNFIKARLSFQTLINTYPDGEYAPSAFLAIADSYYEEGGRENLLQAESAYKDFIIFYPTHEMADDSQMKTAAVNVRLMKPSDRDPTYARKAEAELKKFLEDFPDSELAPTAEEFLREVQENLAAGTHDVGVFYFSRHSHEASESRFKEVLDRYPNFSRSDVTVFRLAESLEKLGRIEEASTYYVELAREYPFSEHFGAAKERLVLLEKDVPEVDREKANQHEANRIPSSFSLLDPVRGVWKFFSGSEDIYEIAKRRAEERRIREKQLSDASQSEEEGKPLNP